MTHLGRLKILNSRHIEETTQQLGYLSPPLSLQNTDCSRTSIARARKQGERHGLLYYKNTKTKCRLYWCLKELVDWRYSQSCWYFRPSPRFVNYCPPPFSNLLSGQLYPPPPPPSLCEYSISILYTRIQCSRGGEYGVMGGQGASRQIKHLPQSPFTGKVFYITTFGVAFYQSNLSMVNAYRQRKCFNVSLSVFIISQLMEA